MNDKATDDKTVSASIDALAREEHGLFERESNGTATAADRQRLRQIAPEMRRASRGWQGSGDDWGIALTRNTRAASSQPYAIVMKDRSLFGLRDCRSIGRTRRAARASDRSRSSRRRPMRFVRLSMIERR